MQILSITLKTMFDNDPDTTYLGEYYDERLGQKEFSRILLARACKRGLIRRKR